MLTKIIYKNFRSNLKNYILFFLSNIVAIMELFVFRGLKEIVLQIVKDTETAFLFRIDFTMALGMISVITIMLMAYAMIYYLKSRIRDYGLFIMMGMHKREVFSLMLIEYVLGWVFSSILGLILGTGILYGIQFLLHKIAPLYFVRIVTANLNIYVYSIKFSIGIIIFTFFAVIVWIENHNLSSLIQAEEKIQKCPQKGYWTIAVIIGIILSVIAWFMFPSYEEVHYDAYFIWIIGGFLILTFGMGVLLEEIKKHEQFFYLKNVLQINQFSSKYQNNLMLLLMFFVIHFFALTYISTEISSLLPIEHYKAKNYPYDMLWMANTSEQKYIDSLADKTKITEIPMMRVTSVSGDQQIGISESYYNKLTGKTLHLKNKQIVVAMQDQNHPNRSVKDRTFHFNYRIMYTGRYSDDKSEELHSIVVKGKRNENSAQSKRHLYKIKKMYTENVIGQYTTNRWSESLIIFSDKYFEKEYKRIEQTKNEPSKLILIKFDQENKRNLWKEIRTYSTKHGTKIINDGNEQNIIYYTESFVKTQQTLLMFRLLSKVFILTALFLNSIFIMEIKVESEIPSYKKKQKFLRCMGMQKKERKALYLLEMQSVGMISLAAGIFMSVIHFIACLLRMEKAGEVNKWNFTKYWLVACLGYIALELLVQRGFALYITRKIEGGLKDEEKCIRS